jgi:hypothetical protein
MPTYYDDNYGHWTDTDDPDVVAFYHKVQAESVRKTCSCCGRIVKIRPEYSICNSCADAAERGGC